MLRFSYGMIKIILIWKKCILARGQGALVCYLCLTGIQDEFWNRDSQTDLDDPEKILKSIKNCSHFANLVP